MHICIHCCFYYIYVTLIFAHDSSLRLLKFYVSQQIFKEVHDYTQITKGFLDQYFVLHMALYYFALLESNLGLAHGKQVLYG